MRPPATTISAALLLLCMIASSVASADEAVPKTESGLFVLDNCDPDFKGKESYDDQFSMVNTGGDLVFRTGGLNNCETIGSSHQVAIDKDREWVWICETVGHRIRKVDFSGKELLTIENRSANSIAVHPETGNLWAVISEGTIYGTNTLVFDSSGAVLQTIAASGFDIAWDRRGKAFWLAGRNLTKVSVEGKILTKKKIAEWCAASLAIHASTGTVWVVVRDHSQIADSRVGLLAFNNEGEPKHSIPLHADPFRVSVDPRLGSIWVTFRVDGVQRFNARGKLIKELEFENICAADVDPETGNLWVVTESEILLVDRNGEVIHQTPHKKKTSQAWIAAF